MGPNQTFSDKEFDIYPRKSSAILVSGAELKSKACATTKILQEMCQSMASKFDGIEEPDVINIGGNVGLRVIRVGELFGDGVYLTRAGELLRIEEDKNKHAVTPIGLIDTSVNSTPTEELCLQLVQSARMKLAISWQQVINWRMRLAIARTFYPP